MLATDSYFVYVLKITNTSGPSYYFPPSIVYCIMINKIRMYTYSELTTEILYYTINYTF